MNMTPWKFVALMLAIVGAFFLVFWAFMTFTTGAQAQGCGPSNPNCVVPTPPIGQYDNRAINGLYIQNMRSGNTNTIATVTGALTNGDCVSINGNSLIDAGGPCTTSGGGGTVTAGTAGQLAYYASTGAAVSGEAATTFFDQAYCNTVGRIIARISSAWTCSQAIPIPANWFSGVDPTGVSDSSAGINTVIGACPVSGCTILFCGQYNIANSVSIGNGSSGASSTRAGVVLQGCGHPGLAAYDILGGISTSPASFIWSGAANGTVIQVLGQLYGWGIRNLFIDCGTGLGTGILVSSASEGIVDGAAIRLCSNGIHSQTVSLSPGNSMHNVYRNISIYIGNASPSAQGVYLDGLYQAAGTLLGHTCPCLSDTWGNTFENIFVWAQSSTNPQYPFYMKGADSNNFVGMNSLINQAGGSFSIVWDYTGDPSLPANNKFYGGVASDVTSTANLRTQVNTGTPPQANFTSLHNWVDRPSLLNNDVWSNIPNTEVYGGLWQTFAPAASCGTATFTVNSATFQTVGKSVDLQFDLLVTALGTCTNVVNITLPIIANTSGSINGQDTQQGVNFSCRWGGAATIANCVLSGSGNYTGTSRLIASGVYQSP